jgi:molecular chaperone Hsp33
MAEAADDLVIPFEVKPLAVRGRLVRLGPALDAILRQHGYPSLVSSTLGEAVALTAMLGSLLKVEGQFILQTSTNGAIGMIVSQYASPGALRAYARFDEAAIKAVDKRADPRLLGEGHLAMTIDQGPNTDRYQGIVSLGEGSLSDATLVYFRQSEQIPTWLKAAVGPMLSRGDRAEHWRAGALMVQHLPAPSAATPPESEEAEDEGWVRARLLAATVEDHELLDPSISAERLLYRIFHEDGVTVYPATRLEAICSCSRDRVLGMLKSFSAEEKSEMAEDGVVRVKCEFCSKEYELPLATLDDAAQPLNG